MLPAHNTKDLRPSGRMTPTFSTILHNSIVQLRGAGFVLAATVVRGGEDLFAARLPQRLVYVMGAEGEGMSPQLAAACDLRLLIPGTGAVESLNVAAATAVLLAQWARAAR